MQRGIERHIPLLDREHQTKGFFTRADFSFDPLPTSSSVPDRNSSEAPAWCAKAPNGFKARLIVASRRSLDIF